MTSSSRPLPAAADKPWVGVELRHLVTLAAVADWCSFRAAAEELGYVQSAVSQQIATLERAVGTRLVERQRGQRGVSLTAAGQVLLEHGRAIASELQAAQVDLARVGPARTRSLSVGLAPGLSGTLLPMIMPEISRRLPGAEIVVRDVEREDELTMLVERGDLDVAVGSPPIEATLTRHNLLDDPYVLLVARDSPLALAQAPPSAAEIAALRLMAPPSGSGFAHAEEVLAAHGIYLGDAPRIPAGPGLQALVASGHGAAIVSRLTIDTGHPATCAIPLTPLVPERSIALFWHRRRRSTSIIETVRRAVVSAIDAAQRARQAESELRLAA